MIAQNQERWLALCALAAVEQDPKELMKLVAQITCMLREKQERLDRKAVSPKAPE